MNSKKIRICFIAPKAYPLFNHAVKALFGGAERDLHLLATELAKDANFRVSFITADYGQNDTETIADVRVIKSVDFNKNALDGTIRVWKAMKRADAQIYFQEVASWGTLLAAFFCRLHKKLFVYRTAQQIECNGTYLKDNFVVGKAFLWSLRNASQVIVQNEADKTAIKQTLGISSDVIPSGHHLATLLDTKRDGVLWIGRSDKIKRPELFIQLAERMPEEHFTMICRQATVDRRYEELVERASQVRNLRFIRHAEFDEIEDNFRRAKLFVCTSKGEGFPNTYVEACIHATPILSLCVNPDNFLNVHGCGVCTDGDWDRFVAQLKALLISPERHRLGKNARRYAEQRHDIRAIIDIYKRLFFRLAGRD